MGFSRIPPDSTCLFSASVIEITVSRICVISTRSSRSEGASLRGRIESGGTQDFLPIDEELNISTESEPPWVSPVVGGGAWPRTAHVHRRLPRRVVGTPAARPAADGWRGWLACPPQQATLETRRLGPRSAPARASPRRGRPSASASYRPTSEDLKAPMVVTEWQSGEDWQSGEERRG